MRSVGIAIVMYVATLSRRGHAACQSAARRSVSNSSTVARRCRGRGIPFCCCFGLSRPVVEILGNRQILLASSGVTRLLRSPPPFPPPPPQPLAPYHYS